VEHVSLRETILKLTRSARRLLLAKLGVDVLRKGAHAVVEKMIVGEERSARLHGDLAVAIEVILRCKAGQLELA
jgi:hypothetical protein